jgi:hypothetical protein
MLAARPPPDVDAHGLELPVVIEAASFGGPLHQIRSSQLDAFGLSAAWAVWASGVRPSAHSVICILRGFAESASGIRRISTAAS